MRRNRETSERAKYGDGREEEGERMWERKRDRRRVYSAHSSARSIGECLGWQEDVDHPHGAAGPPC